MLTRKLAKTGFAFFHRAAKGRQPARSMTKARSQKELYEAIVDEGIKKTLSANPELQRFANELSHEIGKQLGMQHYPPVELGVSQAEEPKTTQEDNKAFSTP